jgi:hypothetical protein
LGAAFAPGVFIALLGLLTGIHIAALVGLGIIGIAAVAAIVVVIKALRLDDV